MDQEREAFEDWLAQKEYVIYRDGEEYGLISGHDAEHAISKMAQHEECDPSTFTAERAWPDSDR